MRTYRKKLNICTTYLINYQNTHATERKKTFVNKQNTYLKYKINHLTYKGDPQKVCLVEQSQIIYFESKQSSEVLLVLTSNGHISIVMSTVSNTESIYTNHTDTVYIMFKIKETLHSVHS